MESFTTTIANVSPFRMAARVVAKPLLYVITIINSLCAYFFLAFMYREFNLVFFPQNYFKPETEYYFSFTVVNRNSDFKINRNWTCVWYTKLINDILGSSKSEVQWTVLIENCDMAIYVNLQYWYKNNFFKSLISELFVEPKQFLTKRHLRRDAVTKICCGQFIKYIVHS